ncbi:MAG: DUF3027 domain-containing protein [Rhodoglobus sp.]
MPESAFESLARTALLEITPAENVGAYFDEVDEGDGVVSVRFDSAMPGYPDWKWIVSIAHVEGLEPSVLEAELMPSEGALLSPDWVPWSDRLAEYKAAQAAADGEETDDESDEDSDEDSDDDDSEDGDDESDDEDSDDESDDDDDDDLNNDVLHGGDLDGVDIDSLDDADADDDESSDDDSDDDEQEKSY